MANLFVVHTQYNLILASGIAAAEYSGEENDLVLFKDFSLNRETEESIRKTFSRVLLLCGSYPRTNEKPLKKAFKLKVSGSQIKRFVNKPYVRVFLVEDICLPEARIMQLASKYGKPEFIYIEDGMNAYFPTGSPNKGFSRNLLTIGLRKIIFKYLFGLGRYYHYAGCFGTHPLISAGCALFPGYVRTELSDKKFLRIGSEALKEGVERIYGQIECPQIAEDSLVLLFDLFLNIDLDLSIILEQLSDICHKCGTKVYYKLHPKQEAELPPSLSNRFIQLPGSLPAEKIALSVMGRPVVMAGFTSTSMVTAAAMKVKVISLIKFKDTGKTDMARFYSKVGISVPADFDELKDYLKRNINLVMGGR